MHTMEVDTLKRKVADFDAIMSEKIKSEELIEIHKTFRDENMQLKELIEEMRRDKDKMSEEMA